MLDPEDFCPQTGTVTDVSAPFFSSFFFFFLILFLSGLLGLLPFLTDVHTQHLLPLVVNAEEAAAAVPMSLLGCCAFLCF